MEQELRAHRDQALKVLHENRAQAREAVEYLVKDRLTKLTGASSPGRALSNEQLQAFYAEMIDLSYQIFSLGYTVAHTASKDSLARR